MDVKNKAEDFFWMMLNSKRNLAEIPQSCSQGETGVLVYLAFFQDKITPSELSVSLKVSMPRIISVLNSLESKNLIIKNIDNDDKRKTIVVITKKGKEYIDEKKEEAIEHISRVMEKLEESEIEEYIRLSKKILGIINKIQD